MSWNLTTSGSAIAKAGAGVNTNITTSGSLMNTWSNQAEDTICALTRRDWISQSGSTLVNFRNILEDTASSMIAMNMINYDMGGYTSRLEAQTMLDVLRDGIVRNINALEKDNIKEEMT